MVTGVAPALSYCVVNTNGREHLLACLEAIERTHPAGVEREILVLDNASDDGSAAAVEARGGDVRLIALEQRAGKAENDSTLMREATGRYCLLLNEDSELRPGAAAALMAALDADPRAGAAGAQLLDSEGNPVPCAWRFPGVGTALAGALFLHRRFTVQSAGGEIRRVDWAQSSALMVRREAAAEVGWLDPAFFVYYDECDFCKRLSEAGRHTLYVPRRGGHPPRPALNRPRRRPAPHRRIPPQPRPLHAGAPLPRRGAGGARPHRLVLRPARPRGDRPPPPLAADHVGPRPPGPRSRPRSEPPRPRRTCRHLGTLCGA
jgi:glycosyltransferase involved in cell wall biosynthesis